MQIVVSGMVFRQTLFLLMFLCMSRICSKGDWGLRGFVLSGKVSFEFWKQCSARVFFPGFGLTLKS